MAVKLPLQVILQGIDRLSGPLRGAMGGLGRLGAKVRNVGRGMTMGLTLPLAAFGAFSIKTALGFDEAINSVQANARATIQEMQPLREEARRLGRDTLFTATEAAQGMDFLSRSGANLATVLRETDAVLSLAAATNTDLGATADKVTDIMRSQGMEIRNVQGVADLLAGGVTAVTQTFEDLSEAFKLAGPQARIMQIPLHETIATLSALADAGLKGSMGGTAFAAAMSQMLTLSPDQKAALNQLGFVNSDFFEASGKFRGPINMLDKLNEGFKGNEIAAQALFRIFERRGARGLGALFTTGAGDNLRKIQEKVLTGDAQKMAATRNQGAVKSFKLFANAIIDLGMAIAESGILDKLAEWMDLASGWLNTASGAEKKTIFWTAAILGFVAALGPVLGGIGAIMGALSILLSVPGLIALAVIVAGLAIWWLVDNWELAIDGLKLSWLSFLDLIEFGVNETVEGLKWMGRQIVSAGGLLPDSFVPGFLESDDTFEFGERSANFVPSAGAMESVNAGPFGKGTLGEALNKLEVLIRTDNPEGVEVRKLPGSDADELDVGIAGLGIGS